MQRGDKLHADFLLPGAGCPELVRSCGFAASGINSEQRCPLRAFVGGCAAQSPPEEPCADSALTLPPIRVLRICLT